jgi:hypothetical protein
MYVTADRSGQQIMILTTDHYLVVAEVRERLAVSKQITHRFRMESAISRIKRERV